jgi:hypothetical protein
MRDLARAATAPLHEVSTVTATPTVVPRLMRPPVLGEAAAAPVPTIQDRSRSALRSVTGIGWSSFFVWIAAGLLMATVAEGAGRRLLGRGGASFGGMEREREAERRHGEPMIPSPGA